MCLQISKKWNESWDMIQSSKEKFFYFFHLWYHEWTCSRNPASSLTGSRMIKKIPFLNEICKEMNLQKLLLLTWIIWSEFPTFPGEKNSDFQCSTLKTPRYQKPEAEDNWPLESGWIPGSLVSLSFGSACFLHAGTFQSRKAYTCVIQICTIQRTNVPVAAGVYRHERSVTSKRRQVSWRRLFLSWFWSVWFNKNW